MKKTNLSKQFLKDAKNRFIVRFQFKVMNAADSLPDKEDIIEARLEKIKEIVEKNVIKLTNVFTIIIKSIIIIN